MSSSRIPELELPTSPTFDTLQVGDIAGGNFFDVAVNGDITNNGTSTRWDDQRYPAIGQRLDTSSGRVDYNFQELTVDFADNARYPEEPLCFSAQLSHSRKENSDWFPHIHWVQNQAAMPNILIEYRAYNNGGIVPSSFVLVPIVPSNSVFSHVSGDLGQISIISLPAGFGNGLGISCIFDLKLYRDSANASGLFAGADTYSGIFSFKEYDIHIEKDNGGSREEFIK